MAGDPSFAVFVARIRYYLIFIVIFYNSKRRYGSEVSPIICGDLYCQNKESLFYTFDVLITMQDYLPKYP